MIRRLFSFMVLLTILGAGAMGYYAMRPLSLPETPFAFDLKQGSSLKGVARTLRQDGLLQQDWAFVILVRLLGQSAEIKAGSYELTHPVSPLELVRIITQGEVSLRQVSIIEGWTFHQMRAALNANPDITHDTQNLGDAEILQRIGAPESHPEGLFFPDTYNFAAGSSDLTIFRRAYQAMQQRLQAAWDARESGLPLETPYQALILASIVEKETGAPDERPHIACVFYNRLKAKPAWRLETDPTVIYAATLADPAFDGNLKRDTLHKLDSPYNTYRVYGLPPGPIANPGRASLAAVVEPTACKDFFFVSMNNGTHLFCPTLGCHNKAVEQWQVQYFKKPKRAATP